jgi:methyl-accepting chemotaxis protein
MAISIEKGTPMDKKFIRKPIGNFFIKKDLQVRLIFKIVGAVLIATAIFAATMVVTYHFKYTDAAFYQVTLNNTEPQIGDRLNIVSIILPSLIISSVVNIVLAFFVGLYASRKYAVPVYKLEQWASLLSEGHLAAKLIFREKGEMKELSTHCNIFAENFCAKLLAIKNLTKAIQAKKIATEETGKIMELLNTIEFESEAVEVHTAYIKKSDPEVMKNKA